MGGGSGVYAYGTDFIYHRGYSFYDWNEVYMRRWGGAVIVMIAAGLVGFAYAERAITGDDEEKVRVAEELKGKMEQQYDIVITESEGTYSNKVGYGDNGGWSYV